MKTGLPLKSKVFDAFVFSTEASIPDSMAASQQSCNRDMHLLGEGSGAQGLETECMTKTEQFLQETRQVSPLGYPSFRDRN